MDKHTTVLVIDEDSAAIDSIRGVLGDQANQFKLRRVADVSTALARIRGGGIDLVLLNLPAAANPVEIGGCAENPLAPFLELQEKTPGVPLVVLCDSAGKVFLPKPRSSKVRRRISSVKPSKWIFLGCCARSPGKLGFPPPSRGLSLPADKAAKSSLSWARRAESARAPWP